VTTPRSRHGPLKLRVRIPHFLEAEGEGVMPVACTAALSAAALVILLIAVMQFGPIAVTAGETAYGVLKRVVAVQAPDNSDACTSYFCVSEFPSLGLP
jgi:hypothetical protein